jgi:limonene-1,2-epoxide hydrolase
MWYFVKSFHKIHIYKEGNITALFKKGDKTEPGNYRPVSLTSVICKTMEKLVRETIVKHMSANKLFSNKQFGFISGRSTTLQLLKVMDELNIVVIGFDIVALSSFSILG